MNDRLKLVNDELRRGIDEQVQRHNTRLLVAGLVAAAATTSSAQALTATGNSAWWPAILVTSCTLSVVAAVLVWIAFTAYDVNPALRYHDAVVFDQEVEDMLVELVRRRELAYRENERQLTRNPTGRLALWTCLGSGLVSVLVGLTVMAMA